MKICKNCGKLSNDDVRICPACGLVLESRRQTRRRQQEEEKNKGKITIKAEPNENSSFNKTKINPVPSVKSETKEVSEVNAGAKVQMKGPPGFFNFGIKNKPAPTANTDNKEINKNEMPKFEELDDEDESIMKPLSSGKEGFPLIPIKPSDSITISDKSVSSSQIIPLEIRIKMEMEKEKEKQKQSKLQGQQEQQQSVVQKIETKDKDTHFEGSAQKQIQIQKTEIVTEDGFTEYVPEPKIEETLIDSEDMNELASILSKDLHNSPASAPKQERDDDEYKIVFPKRRFHGFKGVKSFQSDSFEENEPEQSVSSQQYVPEPRIKATSENINRSFATAVTINIAQLMKNAIQDLSDQLSSSFTSNGNNVKSIKTNYSAPYKVEQPLTLVELLKQVSEMDPAIESCGIIHNGNIVASAISSRLNNELAIDSVKDILAMVTKYASLMKIGQVNTITVAASYGIFNISEIQPGTLLYILTGQETKQGLFNVVLSRIRGEINRLL